MCVEQVRVVFWIFEGAKQCVKSKANETHQYIHWLALFCTHTQTHTTPSSVRQAHNRIFVFIRCTGKMQEVKWNEEVGYKDGSPAAPFSLSVSLPTISNGNQIMYMPPGRRQSTQAQAGRQAGRQLTALECVCSATWGQNIFLWQFNQLSRLNCAPAES